MELRMSSPSLGVAFKDSPIRQFIRSPRKRKRNRTEEKRTREQTDIPSNGTHAHATPE